MEYYAAIKRNEVMFFAGTWMELEAIILSKLTQKQKTKCCMYSLIKWELNDDNTWAHSRGNNTHWDLLEGEGGRREGIRKSR